MYQPKTVKRHCEVFYIGAFVTIAGNSCMVALDVHSEYKLFTNWILVSKVFYPFNLRQKKKTDCVNDTCCEDLSNSSSTSSHTHKGCSAALCPDDLSHSGCFKHLIFSYSC